MITAVWQPARLQAAEQMLRQTMSGASFSVILMAIPTRSLALDVSLSAQRQITGVPTISLFLRARHGPLIRLWNMPIRPVRFRIRSSEQICEFGTVVRATKAVRSFLVIQLPTEWRPLPIPASIASETHWAATAVSTPPLPALPAACGGST